MLSTNVTKSKLTQVMLVFDQNLALLGVTHVPLSNNDGRNECPISSKRSVSENLDVWTLSFLIRTKNQWILRFKKMLNSHSIFACGGTRSLHICRSYLHKWSFLSNHWKTSLDQQKWFFNGMAPKNL